MRVVWKGRKCALRSMRVQRYRFCRGICTTKEKIPSTTSNFTIVFGALFTKDRIMTYKLVQVCMFVCTRVHITGWLPNQPCELAHFCIKEHWIHYLHLLFNIFSLICAKINLRTGIAFVFGTCAVFRSTGTVACHKPLYCSIILCFVYWDGEERGCLAAWSTLLCLIYNWIKWSTSYQTVQIMLYWWNELP